MIDAPTDRFYRAKSPDGRRVVCKVDAGIGTTPIVGTILGEVDTVVARRARERLFRGEKFLRPLDLDNLSRREIPKFIDGAWFGWHAFRRGLGTRLNAAGVNNKTIQSILRHADVSTTQAFYILPSRERSEAGLRKLGRTLRTKYGIKG